MLPPDWTPHRRDDGELLGWIHPEGEDWIAVDVLGREASAAVDWLVAEEALEAVGIGWLSDIWILETDEGRPLRVRILEVTPGGADGEAGRIVVKVDDYGAVGGPPTDRFILAWPLPPELRPPREGDPDGRTFG